ncbi:hypothetical protein [Saccharopolyspora gregorii]|uniref:Uncharacterized protein n=1 Tax=Saccharopolyspora gregorii TaxID=33914 RepID=A0ABP6RRR1_9PSEU
MINPGAIPQIPGDMGALSAHAAGVGTAGTGIADTGSDVHANWQALAPAYTAPESGQLLQATAPVAQVAGNIGRDVEQVSGALKAYADEVRPIQQRLRDLKAQAEQLVADIHSYENQKPSTSELAASAKTGIVPDKDWTDDGDLVDRDAHIMSAVNQAVADWMAAQRRCANTITALYGGTRYTADNADGHQTAGEYGYTADQLTAAAGSDEGLPWGKTEDTSNPLSDIGHFVLDLGGLIPGIGELADGANASWYAAEGDYTNAGLSAAAMIPFAGWGATGGKLLGKGAKVVTEGGQEAAGLTAKNLDEVTKPGRRSFADLPDPVRRQIEAGNEFNRKQAPVYHPHNEITLQNGKRLDSYRPGEEIISRKYTQLSDIQPGTARSYLSEFTSKYSPGEKIADTPKAREQFPNEVGSELDGQMILEVPPQKNPIPNEVINEAIERDILIRDTDGRIYNLPPKN